MAAVEREFLNLEASQGGWHALFQVFLKRLVGPSGLTIRGLTLLEKKPYYPCSSQSHYLRSVTYGFDRLPQRLQQISRLNAGTQLVAKTPLNINRNRYRDVLPSELYTLLVDIV